MVNVFAVPVFFICFRECLETSIIVSVLLAFLKQAMGPAHGHDPVVYRRLVKQVWLGVIAGVLLCICVGAGFIGAFYGLKRDHWAGSEEIWEGAFALLAAIIITIMGAALLRVNKLQDKWRVKLTMALETKLRDKDQHHSNRFSNWGKKYAMFILPFVTVLREGLEAVVFIAGVGINLPASAFPLAVITGLAAGALFGLVLYKIGNRATLQIFLIVSTCFLYLIGAGLFSKAVWAFEADKWNKETGGDAAENGSGPGSYDLRKSVWHLDCCNPKIDGGGGWGVFNSIFGWQNSATYGSVISYNLYWLFVIAMFLVMRYRETRGHLPGVRGSAGKVDQENSSDEEHAVVVDNKAATSHTAPHHPTVEERVA